MNVTSEILQEHVLSCQIYLNVTKFFVARLFKISITFKKLDDVQKPFQQYFITLLFVFICSKIKLVHKIYHYLL